MAGPVRRSGRGRPVVYAGGGGGGGGGGLPAWLSGLSVGAIMHADGNTFDGIRPSGPTGAQWTTRNFEFWGAGIFVPGYGSLGGYFVGGANGGHNDGCNYYGAVWEVSTGQWKLLTPTNTIDRYFGVTGENHDTGETGGTPHYEVSGTTPSASVPAAAHVYRNQVPWGSSVLWVGRSAVCTQSVTSPSVHEVALGSTTLTYSRHTSNTSGRMGNTSNGWDGSRPVIGEYVYPIYNDQDEYTSMERYRPSTGAFDTTATFSAPPAGLVGIGWTFPHLDRYLVKRGNASQLYLFDSQTVANGWVLLTTSGSFPTSTANLPAKVGSNYYWVPQAGGTSLTKLVPPADPVAGTWAFSSASMSSGSFAAYPGSNDAYTPTFGFSAGGLNFLAQATGGSNGMHVCRPE